MKKKLYINACRLFSLLTIVTLFVACDAHRDFPDTTMKPCHILCTDGKVLSVSDFKQSEKQPIAVVFHDCPEYAEAHRLLRFLGYFQSINQREIPPTSLLREFLGGSSFKY